MRRADRRKRERERGYLERRAVPEQERSRGEVARGVSKQEQQTQRWSGVEPVSGGDERRRVAVWDAASVAVIILSSLPFSEKERAAAAEEAEAGLRRT
jgi:hypothetical protein